MSLSPDKKYLLIDTCIVEYLLDKHLQLIINDQLTKWTGTTFNLSISEVSYAELIDGAVKAKIERVKKLLDTFTRIEISQRALTGAGVLSTVYRAHNNKSNGASFQDKIIAATSFVYNLPIITADVLDFPHPFFKSISSEDLKYTKKNKNHWITLDVLRPNYTQLNYWYTKLK